MGSELQTSQCAPTSMERPARPRSSPQEVSDPWARESKRLEEPWRPWQLGGCVSVLHVSKGQSKTLGFPEGVQKFRELAGQALPP